MSNKEIASQFSLLSQLMDIHGENSFKSKTYSIAAYKISQLTVDLYTFSEKEIAQVSGIGEAIAKKIIEIISTGTMKILKNLILITPPGIFEMLKIKGIGPKKIAVIWREIGIENIGELLYACSENRLLLYPGFGKKTQANVKEAIEFYLSQQGNYLYAQVELLANELVAFFKKLFKGKKIMITGEFSRQAETVDSLDFVITTSAEKIIETIYDLTEFKLLQNNSNLISYQYNEGIVVNIYPASGTNFIKEVFETTGSSEFYSFFINNFPAIKFEDVKNEKELFIRAGIQYIPPFLRESKSIIQVAKGFNIPIIIQPGDIKGIIHCHSNWSDGVNSIEQLAAAAIERGKEYLVMSDHSKTATYANGLTEQRVKEQHAFIDSLNKKLAPFKIFKSIESDILNDGSLDYSNSVLSTFDLVIASVHSNLKMNQEKAMTRLLKAIENPYTTILGHMTGRLLLSRNGFPVDYKLIIDACAAHNVVIEINAHPRRLDMRWQWIEYALSRNVLLSIDPDAHSIPEFENTRYGVLVAQKGMLTAENNLSSFDREKFENYLRKRK
ncbi:DNA polymerase/3'-5' exonuclease PolX [Hanamia caeni]|jgi:DNA polymerase (family 10)|uniref:DNA polymerase beta n=1 Tax=Hanamia caeni TaxID=2294116 RepID=A0A3M9NIX2_9BACT|nr:DNA polymerase/3'-5' exonuclease PolX [Hanamia caeni]RNI36948.1 DNA polymerase/3'-5' exonuclease PolX [Hanamia caeni]